MEMPKVIERIEALEERLKQLKARQQQIDARRRALESRQARKANLRRKILAGATVLARVERDALANAQFLRWLDESLVREDDRALFNLPPVSAEPASASRLSADDQKAADAVGGSRDDLPARAGVAPSPAVARD
jgi:hypothetical protein